MRRRIFAALRKALNDAKLGNRNPMIGAEVPKATADTQAEPRARAFSEQELRTLLATADEHESLTFTLATHISRAGDPDEEDRGVPKATVVAAVVARYRDELMRNQGLWYKHHGLTDPAKQWRISDTDRATMEAALVHLIWAEAANLRFCPEFLCYVYYILSHAVGRHLRSITALPAGSGA